MLARFICGRRIGQLLAVLPGKRSGMRWDAWGRSGE